MIPRTFPSEFVTPNGKTQAIVYSLPSVSGLKAWIDYIPVKGVANSNTVVENTYAADGYMLVRNLDAITGMTPFKDYIPVYEDATATKPWSTDVGGYIPMYGLFSIQGLFAAGEQGAWYDPSDINSYMSVLGPELVTNGDFSNGTTGWNDSVVVSSGGTVSVVSGAAVITRGTSRAEYYQTVTTVIGKTYQFFGTVKEKTGIASWWIGTTRNNASNLNISGAPVGTQQGVFTATATTTFITVVADGTEGQTVNVDNISVKELTAINNATLFQDAAGTTPVTAVEQPVGLMLDKRLGLVLGPELKGSGVTGLAGSATAATYNTTTGVGTVSRVDGSNQSYVQFATTLTSTYIVTIQNTSAANIFIRPTGFSTAVMTIPAGQTLTNYLSGNANYYVTSSGGTQSFTVISVRELPGNHAYQSTSAARPVLSARYNLLTKTEQFDDVYWSKSSATVTPNTVVAPDGTLTGNTHTVTAIANSNIFRNNVGVLTSGQIYTASRYVKAGSKAFCTIGLFGLADAYFDLNNLTTSFSGTGAVPGSASIVDVGNGWRRISASWTWGSGTTYNLYFAVASSLSNQGGLTVGDFIYTWGADLRAANDGVGLPAYQRVNTSTDYDTAGFPPYIKPNGSSQFMVTNNIVPGTDKAQVFAGVRKLSDVGGMMVELSADSSIAGNAGTFYFYAPPGQYDFASRGAGGLKAATSSSGYSSPITNIVAGLGNISGDSAILRVNGTQAAINTADQGTGNYLTYPLYLFARAGTTLWYSGRFYGMILRFGPTLTAAQISSAEAWMNTKTKAY